MRFLSTALVFCSLAFSQQSDTPAQGGLTARTLYYNSGADTDSKPAPAKQPKKAPTHTITAQITAAEGPGAPAPPPPPVMNLGVRYNLILVDPNGGAEQPADPNTTFRPNDCLALGVQANYDGYLYVFDRGSSGKWDVLLPSADMTDESNFIKARTTVKAPAKYCFSVDSPSGTEHLFLVLSRDPQDVSQLNAAIRSSSDQSTAVGTQMAKLEQKLASRDLRITKVGKPTSAGEPANAVYVVDTSRTASDRLVTEIQVKHN